MMEVDEALDELEEWQLVGDAYYSRRQLYSLDWAGGGGGGSGGAFNLAFMRCVARHAQASPRLVVSLCRQQSRSSNAAWRLAASLPTWWRHNHELHERLSLFRSIFPAAAGGPVAALRDDTKLVLYVGAASRPDIQILTAAGASLARVLWEPRARVLAAGWLSDETLLVVDDEAQVLGAWV